MHEFLEMTEQVVCGDWTKQMPFFDLASLYKVLHFLRNIMIRYPIAHLMSALAVLSRISSFNPLIS